MSEPTLPRSAPQGLDPGPSGLSAFAAKVLDQLSLSAWLPAALFTVTLSLLLQFRSQGSANLGDALDVIGVNWLPVLLLALPVLVLGTLLTQAFSFGAIRVLEGYWMRPWPASYVRNLLVRFRVWLFERLKKRKRRLSGAAFDAAEERYANLPSEIVMALRAQAHELRPVTLTDPQMRQKFEMLDWRKACEPWHLARFDDVSERLKEYPERSRILPTKLGNVLRATEDFVVALTGEDLVTLALRRRSLLEPRVQRQHDQFRTRLDMYSTLVFVAVAIAVVAVGLGLGTGVLEPFLAVAVGFLGLAGVAYQAAVGSARGYCTLLRLMASLPASPIRD